MKQHLTTEFSKVYGVKPKYHLSCGGRFEILGNHTDHNHGLCLAATCNLAISSAVNKRDDLTVRLVSEGNPSFEMTLDDLSIHPEEKNTSQGLIRGIANYLATRGYNIGGFDVYMTSTIFSGAGVSSSAAFELLIGQIFNKLFNDESIEKMVLCKAGQYSENEYFGKKSGLLDQIGVAYGGIVEIDFVDITNPKVDLVDFPFTDLRWVIVNTGGSHADLSDEYSSIPLNMYEAAKVMGHNFLIEGSKEELESVKHLLSDIQYSRATHFYGECERVLKAKEALRNKNEELFLEMINGSRISSTNYLKNMMVKDHYEGSPLEACDLIMSVIKDKGAVKINGGGFAGSVILAVKEEVFDELMSKMSEKYGKNNVVEVFVRTKGPSDF